MSNTPPATGAWAARTIRSTVGLAAWTAAWVASVAVAAFGPGALWSNQVVPTLLAVAVTVLIGAGMLIANKRNLDAQDEMQRTIQLQVMAWTLGVGLVGGVAWSLFDRHDLIGFEAEIAHLVVLMSVVYLIGSVAGTLRHR
jgi:hypothetical protein